MKKLLLRFIRFYQRRISPLLPPMCRYYPTCSQYAVEAIETHGAFKGFFLTVFRLMRCNVLFRAATIRCRRRNTLIRRKRNDLFIRNVGRALRFSA